MVIQTMLQPNMLAMRAGPTDAAGGSVTTTPLLVQYWHIVQRFKWVIIGVIFGTLVLGLVVTLLMTPRYTSTTRIEISRDQKNITKVGGLESPESGRDLEFYQTQYSLLQARSLSERVVKQLRLDRDEAFFAAHGVNPARLGADADPGASRATARTSARQRAAVDMLLEHIAIAPIRGSALVDIKYTSNDPAMSAKIANAWAQQFMAGSIDRRFASTVDARRFLEGRLNDLRTRLEQSERAAVTYANNSGIVTLSTSRGEDGRTSTERTLAAADLEALNTALTQATADRIAAESRASGAPDNSPSSPAVAQLRQKRSELASDYARLMVQFEPGYPSARALAAQIKVLDASIAREEGRGLSGRTTEYREARSREEALTERVNALKTQLSRQQSASIQYNIYQREADTNRQLYDALLQRYKEIGVAGVGANNIAIVDLARPSERPSAPNLPMNMVIALLGGIVLAGLVTFALNQIDEGFRDPAQVGRMLDVPFLGSVPEAEGGDALKSLLDFKSAVSEAYLSIRSNLAFSTDHGVPRSLMVTSTRPAEGKSTTSFALATVLARTGQRVLLIDADMRNPSGHVYAGVSNQAGLSNLLAGENDWEKLIVHPEGFAFSVMPAGPQPPNAAELLSSDRMKNLIDQMLGHFTNIVVDSPPILGLADAPLLARSVEGSIMVIEAEGVAARGVKSALTRLQAVHAHIFGVVMTKLKDRHAHAGYGYGYGYSYGNKPSD
jgi:succinoglycan biosynthesis transport protein ExoP